VLYEMPPAKPGFIYYLANFAEFGGNFTEKVTNRIALKKKKKPHKTTATQQTRS